MIAAREHTTRRGIRRSLLALVLATTPAMPYPAAQAASPVPTAPTGPAPAVHRVTLLTGDEVTYTEGADGSRVAGVDAAERPGRSPASFQTTTTPDGLFVYPTDVLPYVQARTVDRNLFNITELVREGLADTATATLPVLATYDAGTPAGALTESAERLPAAHRKVTVPAIGGVGLRVEKENAEQFWQSVSAPREGAADLRHGLTGLMLDRRVRVSLDQSAPQIGAPVAWAAGLDGTGTTVAVVDTGIDPGHPDLAGAVTDSANFTAEPDTVDRHGHGTHVASIIAGTGKASGGRYRGVAPGAKLLVAKVFDASGEGDSSQVMAGMQWAAERGAKVVNLSLGAGATDGTDPLSALLNKLSAQTGALFVAASGNDGPGTRTVSTPGAADAALTVGAVDRQRKLAWFSGRGPRLGDAAVKPELVAPGVDIAAARAANTTMGTPLDAHYTRSSGTSMATPHVTAAAAVLAQQHPDWPGPKLKDTLVTTAADAGLRWYEQGSGMLDIARAVTQRTGGPAPVAFGRHERTGGDMPPIPHDLRYANTGDQPLTLDLSLKVSAWDGSAAPPEGIRLAGSTISLPPGTAANASLGLDPDVGKTGVYGGTVVAASPDGKTVLRTPVSAYNAPQLFPVRLRVLDSRGNPAANALAQLIDDAAGAGNGNDPFRDQIAYQVDLVDGGGTISLPHGSYSALGWVTEKRVTGRTWSALNVSEVDIRGPAEIVLDATRATPVEVTTPGPVDQRDRTVMMRRVIPPSAGTAGYIGEAGLSAGGTSWQVRATPAAPASGGAISLQDTLSLQQAAAELRLGGKSFHPEYDVPSLAEKWPGEHTAAMVFGNQGRPEDLAGLDLRDKIVLVRLPAAADDTETAGKLFAAATAAARAAADRGAAAIVPYADLPGALTIPGLSSTVLPQLSVDNLEGAALLAALGTGPATVLVRAAPEAMYNLSYLDANGIPAEHVRRMDPATLVASRTAYHAELPGLSVKKTWYPFPTGLWKTQFLQGTKVPAPGGWTEYTGPGDDRTVWRRTATLSGGNAALSMTEQNIYRQGETARPDEQWFKAPLHSTAVELQPDHPAHYPATAGGWTVLCSACRGGDDPDSFVPPLQWADGKPGHFTSPYEVAKYFATSTARLFQGGSEIEPVNNGDPLALFPVFRLSAQPARYRLDVRDVLAPGPVVGAPSTALFRTSARTDTSWTFTSARASGSAPRGFGCYTGGPACAFQPLIQLEHRFALDSGNQAGAGAYTFETTASSHTGATGGGPVVWLRMSYSTDEGATWREAKADPLGAGRWKVTVDHPATGGFVWLRAEARDASGNTVDQTMRRAYSLRAAVVG
ncbi:S8 family peptidase [Amycolatopsis nigrescens]|uniref:S8 family peptidase n=1 Tax=Amycolatopsis nigrescens TaxID=381445 RepID=UPI000377CD4C|nr:S8 family peptidase [Amycolatopsis nigrescens]